MRTFNEIPVCGGTDRSHDENASAEILSRDLRFFSVDTVSGEDFDPRTRVIAYAAVAKSGVFISLGGEAPRYTLLAPDCDFMQCLDALAKKWDMATNNGFHSHTHGLPADFGGRLTMRYASGEYVSKSNNQSPILESGAPDAICELFTKALDTYPRAALPSSDDVISLEYREESGHACSLRTFEIREDHVHLFSMDRYSSGGTYENETDLNLQTFDRIREDARRLCVFGLQGLEEYHPASLRLSDESLTYVLKDGSRISLPHVYGINESLNGLHFHTKNYLDSLFN